MPHTVTAPGVWAPLDVGDERWYAGRPHMGSPLELSPEERRLVQLEHGDIYDANYNEPSWVLASHLGAAAAATTDAEQEGECFDVDALESYVHSALIVATPVHQARDSSPSRRPSSRRPSGRRRC
eukprot:5911040-Prymnesium_polylepis.1